MKENAKSIFLVSYFDEAGQNAIFKDDTFLDRTMIVGLICGV